MKRFNNNKKSLIRMRQHKMARIMIISLGAAFIALAGFALYAVDSAEVPEPDVIAVANTEAPSTEPTTAPEEEVTSCPTVTTTVMTSTVSSTTSTTSSTTTVTQPVSTTILPKSTTTTTSTMMLTTTVIETTEPVTEAPVINGYTESEAVMLAQLIHLEASATWNGKVYVGSVVLNRMDYFNDSMSGVIFAPGQFTTASRLGTYTAEDYEAATYVLSNGSVDSRLFYFDGCHPDRLNWFYDINRNFIAAQ